MEFHESKTKLSTDNKNDIIAIEPNKIYFYKLNDQISIKSTEQNIYEGRIVIKNNTNKFLIFKFVCSNSNNNSIYSITPWIYYINPKGSINVNFKKFDKVKKFILIFF